MLYLLWEEINDIKHAKRDVMQTTCKWKKNEITKTRKAYIRNDSYASSQVPQQIQTGEKYTENSHIHVKLLYDSLYQLQTKENIYILLQ